MKVLVKSPHHKKPRWYRVDFCIWQEVGSQLEPISVKIMNEKGQLVRVSDKHIKKYSISKFDRISPRVVKRVIHDPKHYTFLVKARNINYDAYVLGKFPKEK